MTIENHSIELYVNGKKRVIRNPDPVEILISYLRRIGLTGTKLGCVEGTSSSYPQAVAALVQ
jgi:xanthine dehydrogenase iron-sulfur cluster and FAD-binding subunit A